jgi:hypothetical protein
MSGASACACTTLVLTASTLTALRERYSGCLCMHCLLQLQRLDSNGADPPLP